MARTSYAPLLALGGLAAAGVLGVGALVAVIAAAGASGGVQVSGEAAEIVKAYGVRPSLAIRVVDLARAIGTHPYWLADLIEYESGGKWTSSVQNPTSKATGLIQITPYSAGHLGTTVDALKSMSEERYLDWAQYYFELVISGQWIDDPVPMRVNSLPRLAMSVYHPPSRGIPLDSPHRKVPSGPNKGYAPAGTPRGYIEAMLAFGGKLTPMVPQGGLLA